MRGIPSRKSRRCRRGRPGFTLVEILVVVAIILLASLVALPVIYSSLSGRQVTDAARIFSGGLVGMRDAAIRYNEPRGIRLLPDPILTIPAPGMVGAGTTQLVYNRFIPIEPAGDYAEGRVTIGPQLSPTVAATQTKFPPLYPRPLNSGDTYPYFPAPNVPNVLMIEESPYVGGYVVALPKNSPQPNSPTSWYWNVRVGDKIKIGGTGRSYTIVGPCVINPWNDVDATNKYGLGNPELFVNVGPPGTTLPLTRSYYDTAGGVLARAQPEFLFVVNGEDDNLDGYVDNGWDNFDGDGDYMPDGVTPRIDELDEWETETWLGTLSKTPILDNTADPNSPSLNWITNSYQSGLHDSPYIITRRPVPSEGAREVMLPAGMVIDATTWNIRGGQERSRIPVSEGSLYCDVMVNPNGLYIPTTEYSSPTSAPTSPFLHFWVTSREDVYPIGTLLDATGKPILAPTKTQPYLLPLGPDTPGYPRMASDPVMKGDRRLITMFTQSGLVVTNTIETLATPSKYQPGEGFSAADINQPFLKAQLGMREAR